MLIRSDQETAHILVLSKSPMVSQQLTAPISSNAEAEGLGPGCTSRRVKPATDADGSSQYAEGTADEQTAWRTAWRLVGSHAWRLLDQGRLRSAGRLGRALGDVGASLAALLAGSSEGRPKSTPDATSCLSGLYLPTKWCSWEDLAHKSL